MYLIETEVKLSEIHGLGTFALHPVSEGTVVWRFDPIIDRIIRKDEIQYLPDHVIEHLRVYSTTDPDGHYRIALDNNKFTNHSYSPNTVWDEFEWVFKAAHDIKAGEELTKDYTTYSQSAFAKSLINKSI